MNLEGERERKRQQSRKEQERAGDLPGSQSIIGRDEVHALGGLGLLVADPALVKVSERDSALLLLRHQAAVDQPEDEREKEDGLEEISPAFERKKGKAGQS